MPGSCLRQLCAVLIFFLLAHRLPFPLTVLMLQGAADALIMAATTYQRMGKLTMAAKSQQAAAELLESQMGDLDGALGQVLIFCQ